MQPDIRTLCQYRLERAKEGLLAAETNHHTGLCKASINRSYYTIFHSIRAVNALDNFDASTVRLFHILINSDFFIASKADSELQLKSAKDFINVVEDYLNHKFNNGNSRGN